MGHPTSTRVRYGLRGRAAAATVLVWVAAITGGCETSSTVSETSPSSVSKCQVTLGEAPPMIDATGGRGTFAVTTQPECAWTASSAANWITIVAPTSGQGTREVSFQVAANPDAVVREGEVAVNDSRVRVAQRAACRYVLTPANQSVGASGGESTVTMAAGPECAWTATTDVGWITLTQPVSGSGNATLSFTVAPNAGAQRAGSIAVAGQRATITQPALAAAPCGYTISPPSQNISAAGGPGAPINVTSSRADCTWSAHSNDSWIAITSDSNGIGNGSVTFSVGANTGAARTGTLSVAGRTFTLSQAAVAAPTCNYSISPPSQNASAGGGSGSVSVTTTSTCAWTATSTASWISVTAGATGMGNGSVSYSVAANTGGARSGTVTIAGQTFTVNQAAGAPSCSYLVGPNNQQIDASGGVATVTVTATAGCAWTATSGVTWIIITGGASGSGNGTVTAVVATNTGGQRTGTLTVAGQPVTIQQKAN
jgi:hypothetical protein